MYRSFISRLAMTTRFIDLTDLISGLTMAAEFESMIHLTFVEKPRVH